MKRVDISSNVTGILICSGLKFEIFPATLAIPKALYPVGPFPMLLIGLERFAAVGVNHVVLVVSRADRDTIEYLIGNGEILGVNIEFEYQDSRRGLSYLLNGLNKKYGKIWVRMVDYLGRNITSDHLEEHQNIIFSSNSIYNEYAPEYLLMPGLELPQIINDFFKSGKSNKLQENIFSEEAYMYSNAEVLNFLNKHSERIYFNICSTFSNTTFAKLYLDEY